MTRIINLARIGGSKVGGWLGVGLQEVPRCFSGELHVAWVAQGLRSWGLRDKPATRHSARSARVLSYGRSAYSPQTTYSMDPMARRSSKTDGWCCRRPGPRCGELPLRARGWCAGHRHLRGQRRPTHRGSSFGCGRARRPNSARRFCSAGARDVAALRRCGSRLGPVSCIALAVLKHTSASDATARRRQAPTCLSLSPLDVNRCHRPWLMRRSQMWRPRLPMCA